MKAGGLIGIGVVVLVLLVLGGCVSGQYNSLVTSKEGVSNLWAQVENQLQRRNDLIGNLVESVKGVAGQEQEVFGQIANARAAMAGAKNPGESIDAARQMDGALGRLLVVVENYPQLRSSEAFQQLMDEIAGTENRLATERQRYNDGVRGYNVLVKRFPMNLFAGFFKFEEAKYYEAPEAAKALPKVDFDDIRSGNPGAPQGQPEQAPATR